MKPKPMSDAEIGLIYRGLTDKARNLKDPRHGDVASLGRAIIAARDAQWAAMIGEPVAWHHPEESDVELSHKSWMGNAWVPLYAIKETP